MWNRQYPKVRSPSPQSLLSRVNRVGIDHPDVATINGPQNGAGFGVPRRASTPEPWKRVLADDGLSYYFVNTVDGTISLTMPSTSTQQLHPDKQDYAPSQAHISPP